MKINLTIRNCPRPLRFQCPKRWEELAHTEQPGVRQCNHCNCPVYFCASDKEVDEHAQAGHCIACEIADEISDESERSSAVVGMLEFPYYKATR